MVFTRKICEKHLWKNDILRKDAGPLPQVFFTHFASKNQVPDFSIMGTLSGNGLTINKEKFVEDNQSNI